MSDVNRKPTRSSVHQVHIHLCPECDRTYTCNCNRQLMKEKLICRDCETQIYNYVLHGGPHRRGMRPNF